MIAIWLGAFSKIFSWRYYNGSDGVWAVAQNQAKGVIYVLKARMERQSLVLPSIDTSEAGYLIYTTGVLWCRRVRMLECLYARLGHSFLHNWCFWFWNSQVQMASLFTIHWYMLSLQSIDIYALLSSLKVQVSSLIYKIIGYSDNFFGAYMWYLLWLWIESYLLCLVWFIFAWYFWYSMVGSG